ncbi:MAG TPA: 30S ribosomal protein S1 [Acidimicrobiia bacterium]|nr:30S ribosomal protein S1 [Acidimicrobiia bacterium]
MSTEQETASVEAVDAADESPETPAEEAVTEETTEEITAETAPDEQAPEEAPAVEEAQQAPEVETVEETQPVSEAETVDEVEQAPEPEIQTPPAVRQPAGPTPIEAPSIDELPDDIIDDFEAAIAHTVLEFNEGDIVVGTVVSVDADGAMVDIGYKSEGLIPTEELSIRNQVDPSRIITVGERVEALVLNKEDDEGRLILSKKRAQYERAWGRIQEVANAGETVTGTVIEVVKGGLIVDIGLRGFLPASLVDLRRVRDLDPFIGQEIEAKVIELDRNRNNVVLSRRAYLEEEQAEQRQSFLDDLKEGEIRPGVVSSVVAFGAFVDLGGMDGLVHVSELSWQHVNHPSEVVNVGDEVQVKVLDVDRDRERISLSIRETLEDPWDVFSRQFEVGDVVEGTVTKTVPFGAFVSVMEGVEGLVHVSEIAVHRVESPELELSIGQKVRTKITEKEDDRRRISLSIKQALPDWEERQERARAASGPPRPRREFEREFGPKEEEPPPMPVDASLEAILQELKERGIGRR